MLVLEVLGYFGMGGDIVMDVGWMFLGIYFEFDLVMVEVIW